MLPPWILTDGILWDSTAKVVLTTILDAGWFVVVAQYGFLSINQCFALATTVLQVVDPRLLLDIATSKTLDSSVHNARDHSSSLESQFECHQYSSASCSAPMPQNQHVPLIVHAFWLGCASAGFLEVL